MALRASLREVLAPNVLQGAGKVAEADAYVKQKYRPLLKSCFTPGEVPVEVAAALSGDRPENCASDICAVAPWPALGNAAPKNLPGLS